MKELSSLFQRLPFTSVFRTLLVLLSLSCTLRDDSLPNGTSKALSMLKPGFRDDVECLNLKSSLHTPLGKVLIRLHMDLEKNKTFLQIDDSSFEFATTNASANICKGDPAALSYFANILERSVPACKIATKGSEFVCTLSHNTAAQSLEQIKAIKLALLRQVKRVPYLLSRRLTLAENLAVTMNDAQWEEGLQTFCGVMDASLSAEQPLILSSKAWRTALCKSGKKRFETALIVLSKAVEEVAFLYILQDQINLQGNLLVHVQNDMLPASGKVWVKLVAANMTMSNVLAASEAVQGMSYELVPSKHKGRKKNAKKIEIVEKEDQNNTSKSSRTCWYPGFSMKENLFGPGRKMQLWGSHNESPCVQGDKKAEIESIAQYFIETISAETTFELSETNTKALSLPAGPYNYTVYEFPDKLGAKLEKNVVSQGLLVWNGSQQGLSIAKDAN